MNSQTQITIGSGSEMMPCAGVVDGINVQVGRLRAAMDALNARAVSGTTRLAIRIGPRSIHLVMPAGDGLPAVQFDLLRDKVWGISERRSKLQVEAGPP